MTTQEVKRTVARAFVDFGGQAAADLKETLFLDRGKCLAIAYRAESLSAVWCFAEGTIEFRDPEGQLLPTLSLREGRTPLPAVVTSS